MHCIPTCIPVYRTAVYDVIGTVSEQSVTVTLHICHYRNASKVSTHTVPYEMVMQLNPKSMTLHTLHIVY